MKYLFSLIYFIYFGIQSYYVQASYLTGDLLELWGKIYSTSHDVMTMFLAIGLAFGWYDTILRQMAFIGAIYQFVMIIFDICWLNGWASVESLWWSSLFFILIFVMNFILFTNGRYIKK